MDDDVAYASFSLHLPRDRVIGPRLSRALSSLSLFGLTLLLDPPLLWFINWKKCRLSETGWREKTPVVAPWADPESWFALFLSFSHWNPSAHDQTFSFRFITARFVFIASSLSLARSCWPGEENAIKEYKEERDQTLVLSNMVKASTLFCT